MYFFSSAQRPLHQLALLHDQATKKDATKEDATKKKDAMKKYVIKKDALKEDARHQSILQSATKSAGGLIFQGRHQFYSYIPTESPTSRFFPVRGMKLDVSLIFQNLIRIFLLQVSRSKINQLFLTSVSWRLTGGQE